MKNPPKLTVQNDLEVGAEVLASEIEKISKAADTLLASRLSEKAIILLLSHHTGVPMKTCKLVLQGARELAKVYVKR